MECRVPIEVRLAIDHPDVGSLERAVSEALAESSRRRREPQMLGRVPEASPSPVLGQAAAGQGRSTAAKRSDQ